MADEGREIALFHSQEEALRLKTLSEQRYSSNNLKSALKYAKRANKLDPSLQGLPEMLIAFKILRTAATPIFPATPESKSTDPPDYYKILQVERFSHINTIKKQYKKLALTLHPDKNPLVASEEAFKLVGEAARVLSDKIRRKEYDTRLRIEMQSRAGEVVGDDAEPFWTACSTCRLLHQFERKYLGHNLMCPSCKKCFKAMEVEENPKNGENVLGVEVKEDIGMEPTRVSARIRERVVKGGKVGVLEMFGLGVKRKTRTVGEVLERSKSKVEESESGNGGLLKGLRSKKVEEIRNLAGGGSGSIEGLKAKRVGKSVNIDESGCSGNRDDSIVHKSRLRRVGMKVRDEVEEETRSVGVEVVESGRAKRAKVREEETMTLAQMQMLVKQKKMDGEKLMVKEKEVNNEKLQHKEKEGEKEKVKDTECDNEKFKPKEKEGEKEGEKKEYEKEKEKGKETQSMREKRDRHRVSKDRSLEVAKKRTSESHIDMEIEMLRASKKGSDLEIMPVEDSDFHDFDYDRRERSFKKGQVWAAYDDDDGMPRHYALIDDVSVNPFEVTLSWLEFQCNGDEELIHRQKMGFPVSCGRFKVARRISIKYLNLFSHFVDNEREAREVYRIYPKKGSVWALHLRNDLNADRRNKVVKDRRCFEIIVSLSSYSDTHGLSIASLEKVDGFRTVFNRREVGANAVQWLGKDDIKLFSHQIPAKKLSGEEASGLPKDCWELDPASLTHQLLNGL